MADATKEKHWEPVHHRKLSKIRKRIDEDFATCYWSEDCRTKDGGIPKEKTVDPIELFDSICDAVRDDLKSLSIMMDALARINAIAKYCLGDGIREEISKVCDRAFAACGVSDPATVNKLRNCDMCLGFGDFVRAWNDYVKRSRSGDVAGFLEWLSAAVATKEKGG